MLRDCKFKSVARCGERPERGLEIIAHCLKCWLRSDKELAATRAAEQQRLEVEAQERRVARLAQWKAECQGQNSLRR